MFLHVTEVDANADGGGANVNTVGQFVEGVDEAVSCSVPDLTRHYR